VSSNYSYQLKSPRLYSHYLYTWNVIATSYIANKRTGKEKIKLRRNPIYISRTEKSRIVAFHSAWPHFEGLMTSNIADHLTPQELSINQVKLLVKFMRQPSCSEYLPRLSLRSLTRVWFLTRVKCDTEAKIAQRRVCPIKRVDHSLPLNAFHLRIFATVTVEWQRRRRKSRNQGYVAWRAVAV
jgi:hypothetical protein